MCAGRASDSPPQLLASLNHPNLAQTYGVEDTPTNTGEVCGLLENRAVVPLTVVLNWTPKR